MSLLVFFPEPLPDEDFRSIVFRYHFMSSNIILPESKIELFGTRSSRNPMFPMRLAALYNRLPIGHSFRLNTFILEHTWAGLISCFLTKVNWEKMVSLLKFGEDKLHETHLFNIAGLFSKKIRYCSDCLNADVDRFGISYIHRVHQLSFIEYCPIHFSELIDACPHCKHPLSKKNTDSLLTQPNCKNCKSKMQTIRIDTARSIVVFKNNLLQSIYKLRDSTVKLNAEDIQFKIMMKLWELQFIHYRGRIMSLELLTEIARNYSSEQIEVAGIQMEQLLRKDFVARFLTLDHMKSHIIFYILIIQYLFHTVDKFLIYEYPIANPLPYGNGPWECLNKICTGYHQQVINHCTRKAKRSGGSTVTVEFECLMCGYTYSKLWKPRKEESSNHLVTSMGQHFMKSVINFYLVGHTIYKIQRETGYSKNAIRNCIAKFVNTGNKFNHIHFLIPSEIMLTVADAA